MPLASGWMRSATLPPGRGSDDGRAFPTRRRWRGGQADHRGRCRPVQPACATPRGRLLAEAAREHVLPVAALDLVDGQHLVGGVAVLVEGGGAEGALVVGGVPEGLDDVGPGRADVARALE